MPAPLCRPRPRPWAEIAGELESLWKSYHVHERLEGYYERVRVLHVNWDDDSSRDNDSSPNSTSTLLEQSLELQETFEKWYKYETKRITLPHDSEDTAYNRLAEAICQETEGSTKHELLILHYQGHGSYTVRCEFDSCDQEEELHYSQRLGASSLNNDGDKPIVQWTYLDFAKIREAYIDNAPCNVLMLMDCCYAGATGCGPPCPGKEVLAASSVRNASNLGEGSFTKNINSILREAYDSGIMLTIGVLLSHLWANYHTQRVIGQDTKKLDAEPVHVPLHPSFHDYVPIILAPLSSVVQQYNWALDFLSDRRLPFVRVDCYCSDDHLDQYGIREYIKGTRLYGRINVHNVYRTGSYVVELGICISTWHRISHHPDLCFRHVIGPEKLNPPDMRIWHFPGTLTIQPKTVPKQSGNPSKPPAPVEEGDTTPI